MHYLVQPILFGTLALIILIGFVMMIKNEIKITRFGNRFKKKLKAEKSAKLAALNSELQKKIIPLLSAQAISLPPELLPINPKTRIAS
jgi:hypothetical protein